MDFVPQNLDCAVTMIKNYAVEHGLSPENVFDMFNIGIFAFATTKKPALENTCMTTSYVKEPASLDRKSVV